MSPDGASNIRVFIRWDDQTVFAGEEIKCSITFKNIARPPSQHQTPVDRSRQPSPLLGSPRKPTNATNANNGLAPPTPGRGRGHRSTLSLNVPATTSARTTQWIPQPQPPPPTRPGHTHQRSLSIVSMGSAAPADDVAQSNGHGHGTANGNGNGNGSSNGHRRPSRGHGRSTSLQISPRGGGVLAGPQSAALPLRPFGGTQASPLFNNTQPFAPSPGRGSITHSSTTPSTPITGSSSPRKGTGHMPDFKFPMVSSPLSSKPPNGVDDDYLVSPVSTSETVAPLPVRNKDSIPTIAEHAVAPAARILSTTSIAGGTPRSSGEFYSMSNNSSETLASEYVAQPLRNGIRPPHFRRSSNMSILGQAKPPEALMMGYAQVQGSFSLDGSLINLGPFEQVKRKAVLSGQGGGVIGLESSRRDSGLLKSFGWGSWGNSIGELLGGGELSSIKEMQGVATSSKSIPLLSTPQSILFVDLKLAPGESKTYEYSFRLPKGLPPSHKGKAMKISYSLVIGTQRPGGAKEQQVRSVDVPFRVLGSVNSHGDILGHDLMSPYIILRDMAQVQALDKSINGMEQQKKKPVPPDSTLDGFLNYVDELLERPRHGMGLLSPTAGGPSSRRHSMFEDAATAKEAIDLAIMRSNLASHTGQSTNRFEISRNGQRVGVVMLARPAYRLGEAVCMVIDFTDADTPCYAVHAALETAERVEPTFALRSEASVHRVTRKVYGSSSEATLFSKRIVFSPTIPINATPEFVTSGLSLEWKIRVEFVVPSSSVDDPEGDRRTQGGHPLLEEISKDDRGGLVLVAAENLECESFEVAVPLKVYGAVGNGLERLERDEAEEGLVV